MWFCVRRMCEQTIWQTMFRTKFERILWRVTSLMLRIQYVCQQNSHWNQKVVDCSMQPSTLSAIIGVYYLMTDNPWDHLVMPAKCCSYSSAKAPHHLTVKVLGRGSFVPMCTHSRVCLLWGSTVPRVVLSYVIWNPRTEHRSTPPATIDIRVIYHVTPSHRNRTYCWNSMKFSAQFNAAFYEFLASVQNRMEFEQAIYSLSLSCNFIVCYLAYWTGCRYARVPVDDG